MGVISGHMSYDHVPPNRQKLLVYIWINSNNLLFFSYSYSYLAKAFSSERSWHVWLSTMTS